MITEVYDALVSAGADDTKARRAAEVLADYDSKFVSLERRIDSVERRIDVFESNMNGRFTAVDGHIAAMDAKFEGRFNLLYWMLGILIASVVGLVVRAFV